MQISYNRDKFVLSCNPDLLLPKGAKKFPVEVVLWATYEPLQATVDEVDFAFCLNLICTCNECLKFRSVSGVIWLRKSQLKVQRLEATTQKTFPPRYATPAANRSMLKFKRARAVASFVHCNKIKQSYNNYNTTDRYV